jgi:ribonuclease Z
MGVFEVLLLGCGAALPAFNRFPSAQILNINEELFLIDCGEGTQFQLSKFNVRRSRIHHVFISHLHGDHVFGLPGLITSYNLMDRKDPLHIYGPSGIDDLITHILSFSSSGLNFELIFHPISDYKGATVMENINVKVQSLPLDHKIPTSGYLFTEKVNRKKLNLKRIQELGIPKEYWKKIEDGEDILFKNAERISNEELTLDSNPHRTYAYCSDTRFNTELIPYLTNVDLLYHETTYLDALKLKASENGHSTALQAATIALRSKAKMLLTGHYSSRYEFLDAFENECKSVFENVVIGREGMSVKVG